MRRLQCEKCTIIGAKVWTENRPQDWVFVNLVQKDRHNFHLRALTIPDLKHQYANVCSKQLLMSGTWLVVNELEKAMRKICFRQYLTKKVRKRINLGVGRAEEQKNAPSQSVVIVANYLGLPIGLHKSAPTSNLFWG